MIVRTRSDAVTDLAAYREKLTHKPKCQPLPKTTVPDKLLDEISYHLLMAARAIAAFTPK